MLIQNISYDYDALEQNPDWEENYQFASSAYGAIVNDWAVCAGYARAFQIVLNKLGYECGYVTGVAGGGGHAWNEIYFNNQRFFFDLTWDDMGDQYAPPDDVIYTYYELSEEQISADHTLNELYINYGS